MFSLCSKALGHLARSKSGKGNSKKENQYERSRNLQLCHFSKKPCRTKLQFNFKHFKAEYKIC